MAEKKKPTLEELLNHKNFLNIIVRAVQRQGVIGEEKPIKGEILICAGKKCINKQPMSTNLHPEDEAGIGKDHITDKVSKIVFCRDWLKFDSPSPTAITYSQRMVKGDDGEWHTEGKKITSETIIYIKDASQKFIEGEDFRLTLEDSVNISKTIDGHSVNLKWQKAVVIITTAGTASGDQTIRRLPSLPLDSSTQQTDKIVAYNLDKDCGILSKFKEMQKKDLIITIVQESFYKLDTVYVDLDNVKDYIEEKRPRNSAFISISKEK